METSMPLSLKVIQFLADGKKYRAMELVKKYLIYELARPLPLQLNGKKDADAVKTFASLHVNSIKGNLGKILTNLEGMGLIQCQRGVKPKYFLKWPESYYFCLKKVEAQEEILAFELNRLRHELQSSQYMLENSNSENESGKFWKKCQAIERKMIKKCDEQDLCHQTKVILTKYMEDFKRSNTLEEDATIFSTTWSPAWAELMRIAQDIEPHCKSLIDAELVVSKLRPDLLKDNRKWQKAYGYSSESAKNRLNLFAKHS